MANRTRVTVNSRQISFEHQPGGDIQKKTMNVMRSAKAKAIVAAPARSGELKRRHRIWAPPGQVYGVTGVLANDAEHAKYVMHGTTGPITSKRPGGMLLVPRPRGGPKVRMHSVRGQRPNDWMTPALDAAVREA